MGLIARYTSRNPNRRIYFFWGIHGVGTLAAVKFVMNQKRLKEISNSIKDEDFAMLVQASFESGVEVGEPEPLTPPCKLRV